MVRRALRLISEADLEAGLATLGISRAEWEAVRSAMRKLPGADPGAYVDGAGDQTLA
jgi:hypothetical protein